MNEKEEFQRIVYEANLMERQMREIDSQLQGLQAMKNENEATRKALNALPKDETLFGIGSGTMVKAKLADTQKILIDIGAGVIAEKTVADAVTILEERGSKLDSLSTRLQNDLNSLAKALEAAGERARELQSKQG